MQQRNPDPDIERILQAEQEVVAQILDDAVKVSPDNISAAKRASV